MATETEKTTTATTAAIPYAAGEHTDSSTSSPPEKKLEHLGGHRQYWRDIILGVNDGLVSTFLLVMGVSGGGLSSMNILLTAISGALAGAISMCAGEYVATKSQNQVISGELLLEQNHVTFYKEEELAELATLLPKIGITTNESSLHESIMNYYDANPNELLKVMTVLEFGVVEEEVRSPWKAGVTSCSLFIMGSLPSVVPFAIFDSPSTGVIVAGVLTVLSLIVVGGIKTWASRGSFLNAAIENVVIAGVGGALAYGVGMLIEYLQ